MNNCAEPRDAALCGAMSLTPKQQRFVDEYLVDLNGTQAAIRCGYAANSANVTASRLLANANISQAVEKAQAKVAGKLEIDAEWVLRNAVDLHRRCVEAGDRSNERATVELIGKHTNIAAFKDRVEHTGKDGGPIEYQLREDAEAVAGLLAQLTERSQTGATLQ